MFGNYSFFLLFRPNACLCILCHLTILGSNMQLCCSAILYSESVRRILSTDNNLIPPLSGTFSGISGNREHAGPVRHEYAKRTSDNTMGPKGRWHLQCAMTVPGDNDTSVLTCLKMGRPEEILREARGL